MGTHIMMTEYATVAARASVMIYDDSVKQWVHAGGIDGISKVQIYHDPNSSAFRVVARRVEDHEVVVNCAILRSIKYNQATPTFHQWREQRQIYGLNFVSASEADVFAGGMLSAIDTLRNQDNSPPSMPGYSSQSSITTTSSDYYSGSNSNTMKSNGESTSDYNRQSVSSNATYAQPDSRQSCNSATEYHVPYVSSPPKPSQQPPPLPATGIHPSRSGSSLTSTPSMHQRRPSIHGGTVPRPPPVPQQQPQHDQSYMHQNGHVNYNTLPSGGGQQYEATDAYSGGPAPNGATPYHNGYAPPPTQNAQPQYQAYAQQPSQPHPSQAPPPPISAPAAPPPAPPPPPPTDPNTESGLAIALRNAKLRRASRSDEAPAASQQQRKLSASHDDVMSEMQRRLAARKARAEGSPAAGGNQSRTESPARSASARLPKADSAANLSQTSTTGVTAEELARWKAEIVAEVKDELQRAKQDIIDAIRKELQSARR